MLNEILFHFIEFPKSEYTLSNHHFLTGIILEDNNKEGFVVIFLVSVDSGDICPR